MKKLKLQYIPVLLSTITYSFLFVFPENANANTNIKVQKRCDERIYNWVDRHYIEMSDATQKRVEKICQDSKNLVQLECLENRFKYYKSRYIEFSGTTANRAISYCVQEAVNSSQPPQSSQDKLIECVKKVVDKGLSERTALRICVPNVCESDK